MKWGLCDFSFRAGYFEIWENISKNPAYGRQSISRPIPKNLASKAKFAKKLFFARQFYSQDKWKFSNLRQLLSLNCPQGFRKSKKFGHWTLGSSGKKTFKGSEQMKKNKSVKTCFAAAIFHPLWAKVFKSDPTSFQNFSSRILKIQKAWTLDYWKWGQKDR